MTKLTLGRALTARVASRFVRLATMIALAIFCGIFIICTLLVYFFSPWWWLLIVPFAVLLSIFFAVRLIVVLILKRVHSTKLTNDQAVALDGFVDKIQALLEARATPPWVFALICIKDVILHRDIITIKKMISDTTGLKKDYKTLEKLF